MREFEFSGKRFLWAAVLLLAGCGGGGSGGSDSVDSGPGSGDAPPEPSEFTASPQQLRDRAAVDSAPAEITLENTPRLSGSFYELYLLAQELFRTYFDDYTWGFNSLDVRNGVFECRYGGTVEMRYSGADTVLSVFYTDCVDSLPDIEGRVTLSGAQRQSFLWDEDGERYMRQEYDDYRIASDEGTLAIDGVTELFHSSADGRPAGVLMDLHIRDSSGFSVRAENLLFDLYRNQYGVYFNNLIKEVSGSLEFPAGVVEVETSDVEPQELRFTGATEAEASLIVAGDYTDNVSMRLGFDGDGDGYRDNALYAWGDEYLEEPFAKGGPAIPLSRDVSLDSVDDVEQLGHNRVAFDVVPLFRDPGGNLLGYSAELVKVEAVENGELYGARQELDTPVDYQLEYDHAGNYTLTSGVQRPLVIYSFHVSAHNVHEESTARPKLVEVPVFLDLDDDGTTDPKDSDRDGDGVANHEDLWPEDPDEWEDTDGDGVGNNADEDDDGDGVADGDDVQPLDALCSVQSDTDGERCLHRIVLPNSSVENWNVVAGQSALTYYWTRPWDYPWGVFLGADGLVYFWRAASGEIHRWDASSGHFLESVSFNDTYFDYPLRKYGTKPVSAPLQNAAYVFYDGLRGTRGITKIEMDTGFDEAVFLDTEQVNALGLDDALWLGMADHTESALILRDWRSYKKGYVAVGLDGEVLDHHFHEVPEGSESGEYDNTFRPHEVGPFCTSGFYFDADSNTFIDNHSGDPQADPCRRTFDDTGAWPAVSGDGERALTSEGIIDRFRNTLVVTTDISPAQATWFDGQLYHLDGDAGRIVRYTAGGEPEGHMAIPASGYVHNLLKAGDYLVYIGIHREDGHVTMLRYREE